MTERHMWQLRSKAKRFCWQCGKALTYRNGEPVFVIVSIGGNPVKTHKRCKQGALDYQTFDTTPEPGQFEARKRGAP